MSKPPRRYAVGKGKPPVSGQFKPGKSGNPSGRPKGRQSLKEALRVSGAALVKIKENGEEREITKLELLTTSIFNLAIKGDRNAMKLLLEHFPEDSAVVEGAPAEGRKPAPKITSEMSPREAADAYARMLREIRDDYE